MRLSILTLLIASLVLASCGWRDSRINPRNWFGRSQEVAVVETAQTNPLLPRTRGGLFRRDPVDLSVPVETVTELRVEPTASGAIIYAEGIARRQGAFEVRLVPDNEDLIPDNGVLGFTLRVVYPPRATRQGSALSRTVRDGYSISSQDLSGVRAIRVAARQNTRETRRR